MRRVCKGPVGVLLLLLLLAFAPSASAGHGGTDPSNREAESLAAASPESEVNVIGRPHKGKTSYTEVTGLLEGHLHWMAFEFLGGGVHCGKPWDERGIEYALRDCPDHAGNGAGAVLENTISTGSPLGTHDNHGWPSFLGWPRHDSLTHEMTYYKWMERAWRGGLRLMVNLHVDNEILCEVYPIKKHGCNEMDTVRREISDLKALQAYVDRKSGGPGKGWFRVVRDPFEARRVINSGKMAVVQGIEVSKLFDCDLSYDTPSCTKADIDRRLDEMYRAGIRDLELVNKFDNGLAGVAMDAGSTGAAVNAANRVQTGRFWQIQTCTGPSHDQPQSTTAPGNGRDTLLSKALELYLPPGVTPVYPPQPHCNVRGLSELGEHLIRRMVQKRMIIDVDHLSVRARQQALALIESLGHSGLISSHSWADEESYPRIYKMGGIVTPSDNTSSDFVKDWQTIRKYRSPKHYFGFGFGSDLNGFSSAAGPRPNNGSNPVRYPFRSITGTIVNRQRTGTRTWDVNTDGVAHYGLYPDWVEDLRKAGGPQIYKEMGRGAEAYLQMWERAEGIPSRRCRSPHVNFSRRGLNNVGLGLTPNRQLRRAGQPARRNGRVWRWCVGGRKNRRAKTLAAYTRSAKVGLIATTGKGHRAARIAPGMRSGRLRGKARSIGRGLYVRRAGGGRFVYKVRRGKVRFVALASRGVSRNRRTIRAYLRMAGLR